MTVVCPRGHVSQSSDYCDECGTPIAAAQSSAHTAVLPVVEEVDTSTSAVSEPCPGCGARRSGGDRYCESCGHDFLAPPPLRGIAWEAVVRLDQVQFERVAVPGLRFPGDGSERRFPLRGDAVRIGRSRGVAGDAAPEIDLTEPPEDPGVSRLHAVLERSEDGTYGVRDLGSTNGTTLNDDPRPIGTVTATGLADGDVIRLGAWTAITLRVR
jgi:hypothetical protein